MVFLVTEVIAKIGRDPVVEIFKRFDAPNLSGVPEEQWPKLAKELRKARRQFKRALEATFKKCKCGNTLGLLDQAEGREKCPSCRSVADAYAGALDARGRLLRRIDDLRYNHEYDVGKLANQVADLLVEILPPVDN